VRNILHTWHYLVSCTMPLMVFYIEQKCIFVCRASGYTICRTAFTLGFFEICQSGFGRQTIIAMSVRVFSVARKEHTEINVFDARVLS